MANYLGAASSIVVGVLLVPLYLGLLGREAYGIIGFYTTFNGVIQVLDLGLGMAVNRELARRSAGHSDVATTSDLVRTIEIIYWAIGAAIGLSVWAGSDVVATRWLVASHMPVAAISRAVGLMGLTVALQWPGSIYAGGLMGLQRQARSVAVTALGNFTFAVGAIALLSIAPRVETFFVWRALVLLVTTLVQRAMLWRLLPASATDARPRFRLESLGGIWRFSLGMTGVALTGIALVQLDKVMVSRLLPLDRVGEYMTSSTAAAVIPYVVGPIFTATLPVLSQAAARDDSSELIAQFHSASRLIGAIVFPIACSLAFFARPLLAAWTRKPDIASSAAPVLSVLAVGAMLNSMMVPLYSVQIAKGWTRVATMTNCVLIALVVPYGTFATSRWGAVGAASTWLVLNAVYLTLGATLTIHRFLAGAVFDWLLRDVALPVSVALTVSCAFWWVAQFLHGDLVLVAWVAVSTLTASGLSVLVQPALRRDLSRFLARRRTG